VNNVTRQNVDLNGSTSIAGMQAMLDFGMRRQSIP
jgi:hypothetical protein